MADNNNNQNNNNNNNQSGKRPFYMVEPDPSIAEFVSKRTDEDSYDVTVQLGLNNPQDKNTYTLVRFVNGRQLPGVVQITKTDTSYKFEKVKPSASGEMRVGLSLVSRADENEGVSLVVPKTKFTAQAKAATGKGGPKVSVNFPDDDNNHSVHISLVDTAGQPTTGKVTIMASQKFEVDSQEHQGFCQIEVTDPNGMNVRIQPLSHTEYFKFVDELTGKFVREMLLKQ